MDGSPGALKNEGRILRNVDLEGKEERKKGIKVQYFTPYLDMC